MQSSERLVLLYHTRFGEWKTWAETAWSLLIVPSAGRQSVLSPTPIHNTDRQKSNTKQLFLPTITTQSHSVRVGLHHLELLLFQTRLQSSPHCTSINIEWLLLWCCKSSPTALWCGNRRTSLLQDLKQLHRSTRTVHKNVKSISTHYYCPVHKNRYKRVSVHIITCAQHYTGPVKLGM